MKPKTLRNNSALCGSMFWQTITDDFCFETKFNFQDCAITHLWVFALVLPCAHVPRVLPPLVVKHLHNHMCMNVSSRGIENVVCQSNQKHWNIASAGIISLLAWYIYICNANYGILWHCKWHCLIVKYAVHIIHLNCSLFLQLEDGQWERVPPLAPLRRKT